MEYEIDQEIELLHNGETIKLKIERNNNCKHCFFNIESDFGKFDCIRNYYNFSNAYCSSTIRTDKQSIIYRKIK